MNGWKAEARVIHSLEDSNEAQVDSFPSRDTVCTSCCWLLENLKKQPRHMLLGFLCSLSCQQWTVKPIYLGVALQFMQWSPKWLRANIVKVVCVYWLCWHICFCIFVILTTIHRKKSIVEGREVNFHTNRTQNTMIQCSQSNTEGYHSTQQSPQPQLKKTQSHCQRNGCQCTSLKKRNGIVKCYTFIFVKMYFFLSSFTNTSWLDLEKRSKSGN